MAKAVDINDILTIKYGKLTVIRYLETVYSGCNREHYYECDCDCGKKSVRVGRRSLLKGDTKSCGCALQTCKVVWRTVIFRKAEKA